MVKEAVERKNSDTLKMMHDDDPVAEMNLTSTARVQQCALLYNFFYFID